MRHGEAEQNLTDIINSDPKNVFYLTENGKKQEYIKVINDLFEHIEND